MATLVQSVYGMADGNPITINSTTAGNLLVVFFLVYDGGDTIIVTSILGGSDTFHNCNARGTNSTDDASSSDIFYAITGGGTSSITVNASDESLPPDVQIQEYAPTSGMHFVFSNNGAGSINLSASGTTVTTPTISTSGSDSLIVACTTDNNTVIGSLPNGGVTFIYDTNAGDGEGIFYLLDEPQGTYAAKAQYPALQDPSASIASFAQVSNPPGEYYSEPDCRNYATFPNNAVDVNGTETYTVQRFDSRKAGAPIDSRKVGAPVPSGTYPQNNRTPGIFGPGE